MADKSGDCPSTCNHEYIGDGQPDLECFTKKCSWDGGDFGRQAGGKALEGCADYCLPRLAHNKECDAACNVASCNFDGADCFHDHDECYTRPNGYDYRGTVSHTSSGKQCQAWSEQTPNTHTMSARNQPLSGVGGHNFCRNPDQSEDKPWCYIAENQLDQDKESETFGMPLDIEGNRFQHCDVGEPSEQKCVYPPPPPPPRMRRWPHAPPLPAAPPLPPTQPPPPERAPISPAGLAALVTGCALGVCALVALALRNRRSSLALASMQLELVRSRAQSTRLAAHDHSLGEASRGEMGRGTKSEVGSTRAMRRDDDEGTPAVALVVTSISKKCVQVELEAPEAEAATVVAVRLG